MTGRNLGHWCSLPLPIASLCIGYLDREGVLQWRLVSWGAYVLAEQSGVAKRHLFTSAFMRERVSESGCWRAVSGGEGGAQARALQVCVRQCCLVEELAHSQDAWGRQPLHYLCVYGVPVAFLRMLCQGCSSLPLDQPDSLGNTALLCGAEWGRTAVVRYLLEEAHTDIKHRNLEGNNLMHIVCHKGFMDLIVYLLDKWRGVALEMMRERDVHSMLPLQLAMHARQSAVVGHFLSVPELFDLSPEELDTDSFSENSDGSYSSTGSAYE